MTRTFLKKLPDRTIVGFTKSERVPGKGPAIPAGYVEVVDADLPAGITDWGDVVGRKQRANGTFEARPAAPAPGPSLRDQLTDIVGRLDRAGIV